MKDVMATFYNEIGEIAASMKVMMLAIRNSLQEGGGSKQKGKVNIPKPRLYARE